MQNRHQSAYPSGSFWGLWHTDEQGSWVSRAKLEGWGGFSVLLFLLHAGAMYTMYRDYMKRVSEDPDK